MTEIRLVIGIPSTGLVSIQFTYSLCGLIGYLTAKGCTTRPESSVAVSIDVQESSVIHGNREHIVQRAIERNQTHLLFLDHDMVFEPNIVDVMMGRRQQVVVTNYRIKNDKGDFVAVGLNRNRIKTTEDKTGLEPIMYSGFGVSLFEVEVFKKTPQPWFLPLWVEENRGYTTEDNPCFERIRDAGFDVYLDHDASKLVTGHVGLRSYSWKDDK